MGLKDILNNKKRKENVKNPVTNTLKNDAGNKGFVLGVQDKFRLTNNENVVVVGNVRGTVHVGDAVYVSNIGDDEGGILLSTVLGIEIGPHNTVKKATDCHVGLCLENAGKENIKCGTVLYTRNISVKDVHSAYISALGDEYVYRRKLNLTDKEIDSLSITDCSELWRLFTWFNSQNKNQNEETTKYVIEKRDIIAKAMCEKILSAKSIYCVFSKVTGEPYLFSKTIDQQDGTYMCVPPDIMIITKAYKEVLSQQYSPDKFEIKDIANGIDKKGIENFLGSTFYLNGACGVSVISEQTSISAEMLVPKPDYSNVIEIKRPVMNPDLERWLLLIGQLGHPDTSDKELIYKLYYSFIQRELVKATLLIPTKHEGEILAGDEDGVAEIQKGVKISFATIDGKYDRPAVRMFTDWKRLYAGMGEGWEGLIQPIDGIIDIYDCAINLTKYEKAGCYISKEMFDSMKKI